jgi:methionyl aminopeptidase
MTIDNQTDLEKLLRIGRICALTLQHMLDHVEPGMTTKQLDEIGAAFLKKYNARSAPILAYNFPGSTCISLNDEAAHGIPGDRVIQAGDMINVDVSAELEGYWADTGASMPVPPVNPEYARLCEYTQHARDKGIGAARTGRPINQIGRAVEKVARQGGYTIIQTLTGHGVGRHIHEKPSVFNFYSKRDCEPLTEGLVITVEPFLTPGDGRIYTDRNKWTYRSMDGKVAAQFEHTIIVTTDQPILVTSLEGVTA